MRNIYSAIFKTKYLLPAGGLVVLVLLGGVLTLTVKRVNDSQATINRSYAAGCPKGSTDCLQAPQLCKVRPPCCGNPTSCEWPDRGFCSPDECSGSGVEFSGSCTGEPGTSLGGRCSAKCPNNDPASTQCDPSEKGCTIGCISGGEASGSCSPVNSTPNCRCGHFWNNPQDSPVCGGGSNSGVIEAGNKTGGWGGGILDIMNSLSSSLGEGKRKVKVPEEIANLTGKTLTDKQAKCVDNCFTRFPKDQSKLALCVRTCINKTDTTAEDSCGGASSCSGQCFQKTGNCSGCKAACTKDPKCFDSCVAAGGNPKVCVKGCNGNLPTCKTDTDCLKIGVGDPASCQQRCFDKTGNGSGCKAACTKDPSCFDSCYARGGEAKACVKDCNNGTNTSGAAILVCDGGVCKDKKTVTPSCTRDSDCPTGKVCASNKCVDPSQTHLSCSSANACVRVTGAGSNEDGCSALSSSCTKGGELAVCWGNKGASGRCYDCNGDSTINILDFSCFAVHYLERIN